MFDVITIGSATRDAFVKSKAFKVVQAKQFPTGKALGISLGSKVHVDELNFYIGGGAVNTALTFARQGLKTAVFTVVGEDPGGQAIATVLKKEGVSRELVHIDKKDHTSYSLILTVGKNGRSILRYDGAVWHFPQVPEKLKRTEWIYLNHLGGESIKFIPHIFALAKKHKIKVAWNPGSTQLQAVRSAIRPHLQFVDVFILNQQEASVCTNIPYQKKDKIFGKLDEWVRGVVVMTRGPAGVEVSDGTIKWSSGVLPLKNVIDRTGAGDAFGSAFVASFIREPNDVEQAIQLASANATSVLGEYGATNGLLKKGDSPTKYGKLRIKKTTL